MRSRLLLLALVTQFVFGAHLARADEPPYFGAWSNGRGETLKIAKRTLQFADDKAVPYRDVTRGTDGSIFELQITSRGEVNAFSGKTLAVSLDGESMTITGYLSHADYMQDRNPQAKVTWEKDSGGSDDD